MSVTGVKTMQASLLSRRHNSRGQSHESQADCKDSLIAAWQQVPAEEGRRRAEVGDSP